MTIDWELLFYQLLLDLLCIVILRRLLPIQNLVIAAQATTTAEIEAEIVAELADKKERQALLDYEPFTGISDSEKKELQEKRTKVKGEKLQAYLGAAFQLEDTVSETLRPLLAKHSVLPRVHFREYYGLKDERTHFIPQHQVRIWLTAKGSEQPLGGFINERRLIAERAKQQLLTRKYKLATSMTLVYEPKNLSTKAKKRLTNIANRHDIELVNIADIDKCLWHLLLTNQIHFYSYWLQKSLLEFAIQEISRVSGNLAAASDILRLLTPTLWDVERGVPRLYADFDQPLKHDMIGHVKMDRRMFYKYLNGNSILFAPDPERSLGLVRQKVLDCYQHFLTFYSFFGLGGAKQGRWFEVILATAQEASASELKLGDGTLWAPSYFAKMLQPEQAMPDSGIRMYSSLSEIYNTDFIEDFQKHHKVSFWNFFDFRDFIKFLAQVKEPEHYAFWAFFLTRLTVNISGPATFDGAKRLGKNAAVFAAQPTRESDLSWTLGNKFSQQDKKSSEDLKRAANLVGSCWQTRNRHTTATKSVAVEATSQSLRK